MSRQIAWSSADKVEIWITCKCPTCGKEEKHLVCLDDVLQGAAAVSCLELNKGCYMVSIRNWR